MEALVVPITEEGTERRKDNKKMQTSVQQQMRENHAPRPFFFSVPSVTLWLAMSAAIGLSSPATAQVFTDDDFGNGPKPGNEKTVERWKIGLVVTAKSGPCAGLTGSVALPGDWLEQEVKVVDEDFSALATKIGYREVDNVRQMVINIPQLPAGEEAAVLVTYEITRQALLAPDDPSKLVKADPKKLPKDIRPYLGPSPGIESQHGKIKALAKRILAEKSASSNDWQKVEALFDWVRNNIENRDKQPKPGAMQTLRDKASNHEGLCWLFIALCRASEIPARTVWVPKYCYPEFYLQDEEGAGYWFPCRVAGTREFGGIDEHRPIWQKGDNFRTPERPRAAVPYIPPELSGKGGEPFVNFVREIVTAIK
jgi:hypothetical protein